MESLFVILQLTRPLIHQRDRGEWSSRRRELWPARAGSFLSVRSRSLKAAPCRWSSSIILVSPLLAEDPLEMLVSLVQVIANPTKFDQKRVRVQGYVVLEFENQRIYL